MAESLFKNLGVGVGLRSAHYERFLSQPPPIVRWVEVITENFLDWDDRPCGRSREILDQVRSQLPVSLHGVSLSVGSIDPLNLSYLKRLKKLADEIQPAVISDHLCWTGVDGVNLHELLPLPYSEEALDHVVERIKRVQDFLGIRIAIENVSSYLQAPESVMTECDFISEMAKRADCGILLDVNNVYVSSINHGINPHCYFENLPRERIAEIHLAGHQKRGDLLIDTHDAPVCTEVWDLYRHVTAQMGNFSCMIERDSAVPPWEDLEAELCRL